MPLLVNMQPAGNISASYYRAGGLPAVMHELIMGKDRCRCSDDQRPDPGRQCQAGAQQGRRRHQPYEAPMREQAGFQPIEGKPLRDRDHEDLGDLGGIPRRFLEDPTDRMHSRAARSCSRGPRTITTASTTRH